MGLGGGGDTTEQTDRLYDYVLGITGKTQPRLLYVPTAVAALVPHGVGLMPFDSDCSSA